MQGIKREKKITVKFFLNEAVEPVTGEGKKKYYPLYVQVTYDRKNMQFKSKYGEHYSSLEEVKPALMQFEERVIKNIISYEANKEKGEYNLKGLKRKYEVYSISILEVLEGYLKPKLRLAILKTGNELTNVLNFNDHSATTWLLYEAARLLFKNLEESLSEKLTLELQAYHQYQMLQRPMLNYNFPTIIEWTNGSYKGELEKKLMIKFKTKPQVIRDIKALIDQSVKEKTKELEV